MDIEEIEPRLTGIFQEVFDRKDIVMTHEMTSADIEEWDSLANIILIIAIEKEFGVSFNLKEVRALADVGGMIDLIKAKAG